jgi:hypothetical protein
MWDRFHWDVGDWRPGGEYARTGDSFCEGWIDLTPNDKVPIVYYPAYCVKGWFVRMDWWHLTDQTTRRYHYNVPETGVCSTWPH